MDLSHSSGPTLQELLQSSTTRGRLQANLRQRVAGAVAVGLIFLLCAGAAAQHVSTSSVRAKAAEATQLSDIWTEGRSSWKLKCGVKNSAMKLLHNNLGGHGPDKGKESMDFAIEEHMDSGARRNVTVEITATTPFFPFDVKKSGLEGALGCINQEAGREVSLDWRFLDSEGHPIQLHEFIVTFFDIDGESSESGREYIIAHGDHASHTFGNHEGIVQMEHERGYLYESLWHGDGGDNPMDPASLSTFQESRAVTFLYQDVSNVSVTLGSTAGKWPRFSKFAALYVLSGDVSQRSNESCTPEVVAATDAAEEAESETESATLVSGELLMKVRNCLAFASDEKAKEAVEQGLAMATGLSPDGPVKVSCMRRLGELRGPRRLEDNVKVDYKLRVPASSMATKDPCKSLNAVAAMHAVDLTAAIEKSLHAVGISLDLSVESSSRPSILTSSTSSDNDEQLQCETPQEQAEAAFKAQQAELEDGARAAAEAAAKAGMSHIQACMLAGRLAKEAAENEGKTIIEQTDAEVNAIAAAAAFFAGAEKTAQAAAAAAAELAATAAAGAELAAPQQLNAFAIAAEKAGSDAGLTDVAAAATAGSLAQEAAAAARKAPGEQSFEELNAIAAAAADLARDADKTMQDQADMAAELATKAIKPSAKQADAAAIAVAKVFATGNLPEGAAIFAGNLAKEEAAKNGKGLGEEEFATVNGIAAVAAAFAHWTSKTAQEQANLAVDIAEKAAAGLSMQQQADATAFAAAKALIAAGFSQEDAMVMGGNLAKEAARSAGKGPGEEEFTAINSIAAAAAAFAHGMRKMAKAQAAVAAELAEKAAASVGLQVQQQADAAAIAAAKVLTIAGLPQEDAAIFAGDWAHDAAKASGQGQGEREFAATNSVAAVAAAFAHATGKIAKEKAMIAAKLAEEAEAAVGMPANLQADAAAMAIVKVLRAQGMSQERAAAFAGTLAKEGGKSEQQREQAAIDAIAAAAAILANAKGTSPKKQASDAAELAAAAAAASDLNKEQQKHAAQAAAAKSASYTGLSQHGEFSTWLPWALVLAAVVSAALIIAVRRLLTVEVRHYKASPSDGQEKGSTLLTAGPVTAFIKAKPDPIEALPEEEVPLQVMHERQEEEPQIFHEENADAVAEIMDTKSRADSKSQEGFQPLVPGDEMQLLQEEEEEVKDDDVQEKNVKGEGDEKKKEKEKAGCLNCIACGKKK